MTDVQLYTEISSLPADLKKQVSNFVEFLKQKKQSNAKIKKRQLGAAKGLIKMSPDFDAPLDDSF